MKTKYRWVVGALLFAAGALNYLDRAAMSVAAPFIKRDLGLDDAQMGVLFSVFFVGYCVSCLLGGWCADRFGPRRVFAWAGGASLLAFLTPQTCWVLVQDIVPADRVGTAGGFDHFLANLAGIASPSITGYIVQYGGGYTVDFAFAAGLAALGAACVMLLIPGSHDTRDEPCSQPTH